jgi:hypothetical protein
VYALLIDFRGETRIYPWLQGRSNPLTRLS